MDKTNKKTLYPCQQHRPKSTFYPFENHTRDSFLLSISGQVSVESIITLANIIIPIKHRYKKQTSSKRRNKIRSNGSQQNIWSVIIVHGWNGYKSWCDQRLLLHDYIHACVCVCSRFAYGKTGLTDAHCAFLLSALANLYRGRFRSNNIAVLRVRRRHDGSSWTFFYCAADGTDGTPIIR